MRHGPRHSSGKYRRYECLWCCETRCGWDRQVRHRIQGEGAVPSYAPGFGFRRDPIRAAGRGQEDLLKISDAWDLPRIKPEASSCCQLADPEPDGCYVDAAGETCCGFVIAGCQPGAVLEIRKIWPAVVQFHREQGGIRSRVISPQHGKQDAKSVLF